MAKINKVINVKVEGVGKIKQLEDSLKKLRKQQRDIKKDMKEGANAGKYAEQQYKKSEQAIKNQSKALRETKKAMVDANNTTRKGTTLQNSMAMGVLKGAAAFSILVTAFRRVSQALVTIIGTFTEFEFTMSKVKAVSGATEDEFKRLSDSAQELGRSTFFTAAEVANLQLNLSKLGFTVTEIEAATEATINLAIATGSDLARSATVAGNAVRGFQLDASETGRVVDVMAVAFTSSALDIEKWQTSMTKVAPIAAMAGFSIEEITAIMSKLSDTGIEASIAGTSLRNILLKMQDPTSDLTKKVGHTITNLDDMLLYFKDLQEAGTDLGDVLTFMDVRQVAAFGTMLNGADDVKDLRDELLKASGASKEMADIVGDNLQGAIFRVKSALQGVSIALVSKFGKALTKTATSLADWLNKIVKTEGLLEKIGTRIKMVTLLILAYVVGVKSSVIWTRILGTSFVTSATSAGFFTTALASVTAGLKLLKGAIATTGIGALILLMADLVYSFYTFNEAAQDATDNVNMMNNAMKPYEKSIAKVKQAEEGLIRSRKEMSSLLNKEGELIKNTTGNQIKLSTAREDESKYLKILNGHLKDHQKQQVKITDNNDDISSSIDGLIKSMQEQMLFEVYSKQQMAILNKSVSADLFTQKVKKDTEEFGSEFSEEKLVEVLKNLKSYQGTIGDWSANNSPIPSQYKEQVAYYNKLMDEYKLTYGDVIQILEEGDSFISNREKELRKSLISTGKEMDSDFKFSNILNRKEVVSDECADDERWNGSRCVKKKTGAKYTMAEKVTEQEANVPSIDNQVKYNIAMLEAKGRGILAFRNQEKTTQDEKDTADIAYQKNQLALNKARYSQELNDLTLSLAQNKILIQDDAAFKLLSKEEQNIQLNNLDIKFQNDKLNAAIKNNIDLKAIENQIDKEDLEDKKLKLDQKLAILDDQYKTDQINLNEALANKEITEIEHQQFMLHLESIYLLNKQGLYAGYGEELKNINNDIKNNTIDTTQAQMDAMNSYISSVGDLGQQMQDLAGDEEKLSGLRKVGVAITTAASTAEKILAIATTITTLATKKKTITEAIDVSMTGAVVAANMTKTASNITTAASGFIATIASAAKSIPFPFNIAAIALTGAALFGMFKKIKSSFGDGGGDLPSDGGGDNPSSSSGGGGGGQMSLMTFGGQHTTVGSTDGYAQGGMVHGNSHAQGGEKFSVGGRVVELEGGEAVINKRSTSMFRSQLSAMNYAGGGVSFADGGVTNVPSFAQTQFQVDGQRGIQGAMSQRSKVVVVEADITKSQNRVSAIEAEASF